MQIFVKMISYSISNIEHETIPAMKPNLNLDEEQSRVGRTLSFCSLTVKATDTIKTVKVELQKKETITIVFDEMRLFFGNTELQNYEILQDHVEDGSVLHLVSCSKYRMPIFIENMYKKAYTFVVEPSDTVESVKIKIQGNETGHILLKQIRLFYAGNELDDVNTLENYDIQVGSVLYLELCSKHRIEVFVETLYGRTFILDVEPLETIEIVKTKIQRKEGILVDQIRLFFDGIELKNCRKLKDYEIENKSILHMAVSSLRYVMEIFVKLTNGTTLTVLGEPSDTIEDLKTKIKLKDSTSSNKKKLVFLGKEVMDFETIKDCNIVRRSTLYLVTHLQDSIQIFVKTPDGRTLTTYVTPVDVTKIVKAEVQRTEGILADEVGLLFNETELEDHKTFSHYNIEKGSLLHLLYRSECSTPISFKTSDGKTVILEFESWNTTDNVKVRTRDMKRLFNNEVMTSFNKKSLADGGELSNHNFTDGTSEPSLLHSESLSVPRSKSRKRIQIFILLFSTGDSFNVTVDPTTSVLMLKSKIEEIKGYPVEEQRLIFKENLMGDDEKTLIDYKVKGQSKVLLRILRGGS